MHLRKKKRTFSVSGAFFNIQLFITKSYYYIHPQATELLSQLFRIPECRISRPGSLLLVYAVSYSLHGANGLKNTSGKSISLSACTQREQRVVHQSHPKISTAGWSQRQAIELELDFWPMNSISDGRAVVIEKYLLLSYFFSE